jgi:fatty-acyl-CoA synthase
MTAAQNAAMALLDHYAAHPDRLALRLLFAGKPDVQISYRRLVEGAAARADQLRTFAIGNRPCVIILPHGETLVQSFWGAVLAGAIPSIMAPLSEKLSPEKYRRDLSALIGVSDPAVIVTDSGFEAEARAAVAASGRACGVLVLAEPRFAPVDAAALPGLRQPADAVMLLQHSSGTTGLQKGVALSHNAIFAQTAAYARAIDLSASDVIASWLPLYHDMGLIASFVMPVLRGVPVVMLSPFDWVRAPARLLQAISTHGATLCWQPNFAYNFTATRVRDRELGGVNLASMRAFINCSEPCYQHSHDVFAARFAALGLRADALHTCYAMAENTFAVTQSRPGSGPARAGHALHLSSGASLDNVQVRVLDEADQPVAEGATGNIVVRSNCMMTGYYHRPELSEAAFADGFYRTGDLGHIHAGELYVTGRKKDLIIVGGKNVYPNDLEQLAGEVPGVHAGRVAAFGVYDAEAGTEDIVVVAEADADTDDAREALADAVRARITQNSDVTVRLVRIVPPRWLIKTSSGKVARGANREKWEGQKGF